MNYLLQDMPTYQMVEMEQVNIMVGLIGIIAVSGILYMIANHIIQNKKKKES